MVIIKYISIPIGINSSMKSWDLYLNAIQLRKNILWKKQTPKPTFDTYSDLDKICLQTIAIYQNIVVGCVSLENNRIRQLVVSPFWNGKGIGTKLIENITRESCHDDIIVNSIDNSVGFYLKNGFKNNGKIYESMGQKCQPMIKKNNIH